MKSSILITAAVLGLSAGAAPAVPLQSPPAGQAILTSRGPVITTGRAGTVQTTTLPGGGGQGLLFNNGNGTSTLTGPSGFVSVVATPR
jgi:hypothetical protein